MKNLRATRFPEDSKIACKIYTIFLTAQVKKNKLEFTYFLPRAQCPCQKHI